MEAGEEKTGSLSAAQRRAEIRRRKLLMNSEDRMNRIVGYAKNESENNVQSSNVVLNLQQECPGVPQNPTSTSTSTGQSRGRHPHLPRDPLPSCQRLRGSAAALTVPPRRGGPHPC
ncbi:hypothetical protein GBF38_019711 [Nibea albiflora]|uniref:Uncharacterized protein n=1 Tax=Nibea albiflora TaxID=240163 RepID=A0ACB7F3K9_NIBAL|nr:hypothetical protein GBF38_019711 [Nibea albiflora]